MRIRVWSLASIRRLRIQHCCELWCRSQTQLESCIAVALVVGWQLQLWFDPSLGTSICSKCVPRKTKKFKKLENTAWMKQRCLMLSIQQREIVVLWIMSLPPLPFFFFLTCCECTWQGDLRLFKPHFLFIQLLSALGVGGLAQGLSFFLCRSP